MGFFGRLFTGKPAFEAPHDDRGGQSPPAPPTPTPQAGPKYIPEVEIEEIHCHVKDQHMRVEADIKNRSTVEIKVEGIILLGSKRQLSQHLKPGEERKMMIYDGPLAANRNNPHAYLNYQGMDSDDFQTYHVVEFKAEPGNTYSIKRLKRDNPVKDT